MSVDQTWMVLFREGEGRLPGWARWFVSKLRPGFRHCEALRYDVGARAWLLVDPSWRMFDVRVITHEEAALRLQLAINEGDVIEFKPLLKGPGRQTLLGPLWCSTTICRLLGLPRLAWTPYRLRNRLIRLGGRQHGFNREEAEGAQGEWRGKAAQAGGKGADGGRGAPAPC